MPDLISRSVSFNSQWAPDKYWLWSPMELHERWKSKKALQTDPNFKQRKNLAVVNCDYEEAPIIAALYLREVHDIVDETYYDIEEKKLYLYYGGRGDAKKKKEDKELVNGIAKRKTIAVVKKTLFKENMLGIMMDKYGARLFKKATAPAEAMGYA